MVVGIIVRLSNGADCANDGAVSKSWMEDVPITRRQILTIGPIVLVALCYVISAPSSGSSTVGNAAERFDENDPQPTGESLTSGCERAAFSLRERLGSGWSTITREPYVIGGDCTEQDLEERYRQTIVPTTKALSISYFSTEPDRPISILICSTDERFRECNLKLDDQERRQYSGIYSRKHRRLIVNIGSGEGTLAHELTHALAHVDFPRMPEWFDEGLASLHEECEFSADGLRLIGLSNWRREVAFEALNRGELRLLLDVTSNRFGTYERANTDYALVRSFCLYLQETGLLETFYRACRDNVTNDPTGLRSLCRVANASDPQSIDDDFRAWLIKQGDKQHPENRDLN